MRVSVVFRGTACAWGEERKRQRAAGEASVSHLLTRNLSAVELLSSRALSNHSLAFKIADRILCFQLFVLRRQSARRFSDNPDWVRQPRLVPLDPVLVTN